MLYEDYLQIPGKLSLKFESDSLDLLQVGVLGTHLHSILNQVAITVLQVTDELERDAGRTPALRHIPQTYERQDALVKARLVGFREGSIEMEIAAVVAQVFSQPGAVSVLNNLLSNAIWAIGTYASRASGIFVHWKMGQEENFAGALLRPQAGRKRLRPKVEKFVKLLADSANGGRLRLRTDEVDFEIEFNPRYGEDRDEPDA